MEILLHSSRSKENIIDAVGCRWVIDCECWYDTDDNDVCDDDGAVECISEIDCATFCDTNNEDDDDFVRRINCDYHLCA